MSACVIGWQMTWKECCEYCTSLWRRDDHIGPRCASIAQSSRYPRDPQQSVKNKRRTVAYPSKRVEMATQSEKALGGISAGRVLSPGNDQDSHSVIAWGLVPTSELLCQLPPLQGSPIELYPIQNSKRNYICHALIRR